MKNILTPLAKSVLIPLGLSTTTLATDATIQKTTYGSRMTTLTIKKKEIKNIMEIVKSFEESGLLMKGVNGTIENEAKLRRYTNF